MIRNHLVLAAAFAVATAAARAQSTVSGTVFNDRNGDGIQQGSEPGLRGVAVSNQDIVVVTDSLGHFALPRGPNHIIFVSTPDNYRAMGSFWKDVGDSVNTVAFALRASPAPKSFTFIDASDTHISPASVAQTQRFRAIVDSVKPDFVLIAGDLVKDALRVSEAEARGYYDLAAREFGLFKCPVWLVPGNHENFGIETALSHVDPANPLFGRAMYHHYFGPDYYSFNRGGVHFVGLNSVDISGTSYYGHVDSVQLAWLGRDLSQVPPEMPVVTFNHIPLLSAMNEFDGVDDGPPAPTLITVNGKTSFRHIVSNGQEVLAELRKHNTHVLAIGAHSHVGERVVLFNEGVRTVFAQSPAVVGPAGAGPFVFPSGIVKYRVNGGRIGEGEFVPVDA
ncbi:MAG TPA: metallophosphoesterase, partial [Gemmatimonadaceae bacterium]|nr:metallophosphoesterase [Gemmatimonadaceae bacterium]